MINVAELHVQYITDNLGEKTAVVLPIDDFEELLEDLEDLATIAERRSELTTPHETVLTELQHDGLV